MDELVTEAFRSAVTDAENAIDPNKKLADFVVAEPKHFWADGSLSGAGFGSITAACAVTVMGGLFLFSGLQSDTFINSRQPANEVGVVEAKSAPENAKGQFNNGGGNGGLTDYEAESVEAGGPVNDDPDRTDLESSTGSRSSGDSDGQGDPDESETTPDAESPDDEVGMNDLDDSSIDPDDTRITSTTSAFASTIDDSSPTPENSTSTTRVFPSTSSGPVSSTTIRPTTVRTSINRPSTTGATTTTELTTTSALSTTSSSTSSSISTTIDPDPDCSFSVPVGASIAEAKSIVATGGCVGTVIVLPAGSSGQLGRIVGGNSQTISATETVTIYGRVAVPNIVGATELQASLTLAAAGLTQSPQTVAVPFGDSRAGLVVSQSTTAGVDVTYKATVRFTVGVEAAPTDPNSQID